MKLLKSVPLHVKILIALVLGAIWGSVFSVQSDVFIANYENNSNQSESIIADWDKIEIQNSDVSYSRSEANKFFNYVR